MLNQIVLVGRLTRAPELRYTPDNTPVCTIRLAVNRDRGEITDFVDVVAWRQTAEFVNKYFDKGNMIVVTGRLQMRDWQDKDGNKRTTAEVVADRVYFAESRKTDAAPPAPERPANRAQGSRSLTMRTPANCRFN